MVAIWTSLKRQEAKSTCGRGTEDQTWGLRHFKRSALTHLRIYIKQTHESRVNTKKVSVASSRLLGKINEKSIDERNSMDTWTDHW